MNMKYVKIRKGTFETNSSSAHTLVIKNSIPENTLMTPDEVNKELSIWYRLPVDSEKRKREYQPGDKFYLEVQSGYEGGEFGREFRVLSEWYRKLDYYLAENANSKDLDKKLDELVKIVGKYLPDCVGLVVDDASRDSGMFLSTSASYFGNVDHQSVGTLTSFMRITGIDVEELIFNKRYVIIVDSDECCIFDSIKNSGLMDNNITTYEDLVAERGEEEKVIEEDTDWE